MPSGHFPPTGPSSNRPQKSETSGLSHKPIIIDGLQTYEEFEKFVMLLGPLFNECNTDEEYVDGEYAEEEYTEDGYEEGEYDE